jgi:hypothetical protein
LPRPSQVAKPTRFAADTRSARLEEELKEMREQMKEMKVKSRRRLPRISVCSSCRKPKSNDNGIYEREIEREEENGG